MLPTIYTFYIYITIYKFISKSHGQVYNGDMGKVMIVKKM